MRNSKVSLGFAGDFERFQFRLQPTLGCEEFNKFSLILQSGLHLKAIQVDSKMASIFDDVEKGPPIEVFALNKAFLEDSSTDKVNLGVGGTLRGHLQ